MAHDRAVPDLDRAKLKRVILVTYVITTLDVTWMFLQFSVTPFLARRLGMDTLWLGYLQTVVGLLQLIGNPLFGRFGDLFGARAALSVATGATVVFFLLLASAQNPAMLFLHKLPTLFMHVVPVSQMVLTDLSEPALRGGALSKLGVCFGVGMILGSMMGGHLVMLYGERLTACVGAAGSLCNLLLVLKFIPKNTKSATATVTPVKKSLFSLGEITRLLQFPGVAATFSMKVLAGLPSGIFQSMFSVVALEDFKLDPQQNSHLMTFFGFSQILIQGAVIGRLTERCEDSSLLLLAVMAAAAVGLGQAYMRSVVQFCLTMVPMVFSMNLFNVVTDSILTKSVPASDTGTMLGLCATVQSLLRTVGPTLGGVLYLGGGLRALGLTQCLFNAAVFCVLLLWPLKTSVHQE
ncbi:unnamed protein product [Knipowitschia caucasica]